MNVISAVVAGLIGTAVFSMVMWLGTISAIIYAALWSAGIGSANAGSGALFGIVHWLAVGLVMGIVPALHAGMRAAPDGRSSQ
jgi:hypothetical protein